MIRGAEREQKIVAAPRGAKEDRATCKGKLYRFAGQAEVLIPRDREVPEGSEGLKTNRKS